MSSGAIIMAPPRPCRCRHRHRPSSLPASRRSTTTSTGVIPAVRVLVFALACGGVCREASAFAPAAARPATTSLLLVPVQKRQGVGGGAGLTANVMSVPSAHPWEGGRIVDRTRSRGKLYFLLGDNDEDEGCSINNLDACLAEGKTVGECFSEKNRLDVPMAQGEIEDFARNQGPLEASEKDNLKQFLSMPIVEVQLALLVIASSFLVGLGTIQSLPPTVAAVTKNGELIISAIFTVEYVLRWMLTGFSARYVVQPFAMIDLVAILPGLIKIAAALGAAVPPSLMGGDLINLRLLRILRLQRVLVDYETFAKFELALGLNPSDVRPYQLQLARIVISIFTLLSVTAGLIYSAEHVVNPAIPDYFTALYFTLTTLTTVGFGDISPVTTAGRWIVGGSILVGSAVIPAQAAALVEVLLNRQGDQQKNNVVGSDMANTASITNGDSADTLYLTSIQSRIDRLEQKVEDTNARLDSILAVLEDSVTLVEKEEAR